MYLNASCVSARILYSSFHNGSVERIIFNCTGDADRDILELADDYVFCNENLYRLHYEGKRELCEFNVHLNRLSALANFDQEKVKFALGGEGIGRLNFNAGIDGSRANLQLTAYIADALFEKIQSSINSKVNIDYLNIEYARELDSDELKFGWEPDGSRVIWSFNADDRRANLSVNEVNVFFAINNDVVKDNEIELLDEGNGQNYLKSSGNDGAEYTRVLTEIKYLLLIIVVFLVLLYFKT